MTSLHSFDMLERMQPLAFALVAYLIIILVVATWSKSQIHTEEDFMVAGRRLPLSLSTFTLLATWFGAGTLITATDEVYHEGLRVTALEPYGAGFCLILAGILIARPLWEMKICTFSDFYRQKFGPRAEMLSVAITIPIYLGWIAVQLVALAGILDVFLSIPPFWGILLIAAIAMFFTLIGGMWSVTITDSVQLIAIIIGLFVLLMTVFVQLGQGDFFTGWAAAFRPLDPKYLKWVPTQSALGTFNWINLFLISALGNLSGQDLGQRIFAAKSAKVAKNACILAGIAYIFLGSIPVALGLAAKGGVGLVVEASVIPSLAKMFLTPAMTVIFILALVSMVLSTITSAILAPSTTLALNGLRHLPALQKFNTLSICRFCVFLLTLLAVVLAFSGERAYSILEASYALGLVSLLVPVLMGIYGKRHKEKAAIAAMVVGLITWTPEFFYGDEIPFSLIATLGSLAAYLYYNREITRT